MRLSKRAKAALKALRHGHDVDMSGWTRDEALAVLRAALEDREKLRKRALRLIDELERDLASIRKSLPVIEADIATLRALIDRVEAGHADSGEGEGHGQAVQQPGPAGG